MKKIIVLDLEFCMISNGNKKRFKQLRNEIIEIGAVMLDEEMNTLDTYQKYVKPQYSEVSKKITNLTGITNEMLRDKEDFEPCIKDFIVWLGEDLNEVEICSWSMTDLEQIKCEIEEKNIELDHLDDFFDGWREIQKEFSKGLCFDGIVSLEGAMHAVDENFAGKAHDALADAQNTAKLVMLMKDKKMFEKRTKTLRSLFEKKDTGYALGADLFKDFLNP